MFLSMPPPGSNFLKPTSINTIHLVRAITTFSSALSPSSPLPCPSLSPLLISKSLLLLPTNPHPIRALHNTVTPLSETNPFRRESKMTVTATPCIKNGCLLVNGKVVSTEVPSNVVVTPVSGGSAFLGATSSVSSCRHSFSLGILEELRFLSLFRFKMWWMIPRVGRFGSEIPIETQFLLLEAKEGSALCDENSSVPTTEDAFYILLLPVLDGPFRTSLMGTPTNELHLCIESGDAFVQTDKSNQSIFLNSGHNPFELIKNSVKMLERHMGTFTHIDHKKVPGHLDWFGWCSWDAFYKDVTAQGVKEGIQSLLKGGVPPKFVIIDDGWQETVNEFHRDGEPLIEGTFVEESSFATRLVDIIENSKFRDNDACSNLHEFITSIREKYGLKFVYMWHALVGYWGGVLPSSEKMKKYNPKMVYPKQSPGNVGNLRDVAMDSMEKFGIGLVDPEKVFDFYNDLHRYLASCGADGVKVDVQAVLETLGSGHGGRVSLTRKYHYSLEQSVLKNFKDNSIICSMCHNTDSIYSAKLSAVARASADFMPREPTFQTLHVAAVAFNSLLLGEIMVPDWDMFHSKHDTAEFHAAARAIGGCSVYVSDKPGIHDFKVLTKLVLPDGSILRARRAGRPTRDCLFVDPVTDGKSLMKIWNMNKFSGIIGVFNCQGAGNWPLKQSPGSESTPLAISGYVSPLDVEYLAEVASDNWSGDTAVYKFFSGSLLRLPQRGSIDISLATLQCEIFTISPVKVFSEGIHFAPLGLIDMYNSGGAIEALSGTSEPPGCKIKIKVRGCGRFGAYSNSEPKFSVVDMKEVEFMYNANNRLLTLMLGGDCNFREIEIVY